MKVLLLNGSPHAKGCTYTALREVAVTLERHSLETEILQLDRNTSAGCLGCNACHREGAKGCFQQDMVNEIGGKLDQYDALVLGSPVYYAGPNGQFLAFLDRLFYSHGSKMKGKLGAAVVSCRRGGSTAAFDRLNKYFTISNMPIVSSKYWNQVHGYTPEDVMQDKEGLQVMRTLGENMAWLLKCIEAGKQAGVPDPVYELPVATNFIR